jgi:hypothetical protein
MGIRTRIACLGIGAVIGLTGATQFMAWRYDYQPALGWGLVVGKSEVSEDETSIASPSSKSHPPKSIRLGTFWCGKRSGGKTPITSRH